MIKPIYTNFQEIREALKRLSFKDKLRLANELNAETEDERMNQILSNIDKRRKNSNISDDEIAREIEKARKSFYARRR